ncbi:transposase [Vulcanisaeta sp. EB80]|uniref:RNA-guided endonuclease InsQ/TnpB family protein n=1 Tax=Vulcanisaeta sp. EB80 TaxID=1650660 RepID=UPI001EE4B83B|nr:transposase [Vulcanisaeta sp. EB80]
MPGLVPPRGGLVSLDELVGRLPTVFANPGTPSSSKRSNVRTVRLRLLPSGSQERKLRRIADATARLWNELNYARLVQYRETGRVDFEDTEHEFYYKYNSVLGVNAGQVINLNNNAWKSYFELLKLYRQGRLPKFYRKPSPPGFWKDKVLGKRTLRILVRNDRYYIEPINNGEGYLVLKDWGLKIKYAGRIKWSGKQGMLVIKLEDNRWFAYVPITVGEKPAKSNPKGYVRGIYEKIQIEKPRGNNKAFIDIGLNNLFAVVFNHTDVAILIKGSTIKSEYYWWKREIKTYQAIRDWLRNHGFESWKKYHTYYLHAVYKQHERLRHYYRTAIRFLAKEVHKMGVDEVFIGYPYMVSQDNGNEYNTNIWWFNKIINWLKDVLEEYGIKINVVNEYGTSKQCSICNMEHEKGRVKRGLYVCELTGIKINADLNAARNIAKKVGYEAPIPKKILSYIVTTNGVKPITPKKGQQSRPPKNETRPKRAGKGVIHKNRCTITTLY